MTKNWRSLFKIAIFSLNLAFFGCSNPLEVSSITKENDFRAAKGTDQISLKITGGQFGTTEPSGELTYKVGTSIDISFTENDSYQFEKWEVVNSATGKPVNDVIKIEEINELETQITIRRAAENIVLRPVCKLRPQVLSSIPGFTEAGVYRDSIIIITFDTEISAESFYYSAEELSMLEADSFLSSGDKTYGFLRNNEVFYKNLKITSGDDVNLLEYFEPPVIENGTIIKIKPKADKILLQPNQTSLDIDVCLSPEVTDVNGVSIGAEGVQWRYRINPNTDTTPPEITKFSLAQDKSSLNSGIAANLLVSGNSFNPLNHIKDTLYYSCDGKDDGSGISYLMLETKRLTTAGGEPVEEKAENKILEKLEGSVVLQNDDGLIQVSFTLYDLSGNASKTSQKYLIAKDTTVDLSACHLFNKHTQALSEKLTPEDLTAAARTICWKGISDDVWYKDNVTLAQDLNYVLYWGTEENKVTKKIKCSKDSCFKDGTWSVELPETASSSAIFIKLSVTDSVGNENSVSSSILANPTYFTYQKISDAGEYTYTDKTSGKEKTIPYPAHYRVFSSEGNVPGYLYYLYDDETTLQTQSFLNLLYDSPNNSVIYDSEKYFDIYTQDISKCKFFFQSVNTSNTFSASLGSENDSNGLLANIKQKVESGAFLKEIEAYSPDLRNAYLIAKIKGLDDDAERIANGFYLWNYFAKYEQANYFSSILYSPVTSFTITESEDISAPEIDSIKITKGNVNSGVNKANIKYGSSASEGKIFGFFWGDSEENIVNYEKKQEFNITSGISTLYFKTVAIDLETGKNVLGPVSVYDLSDYAFDTAAPKIEGFNKSELSQNPNEFRASEYYPVVTCEICYDNFELTNGLAQYTLFVVPAESKEQTFDQLSEETIHSSPSIVNTFVPPESEGEKIVVWNNVEGLGSAEAYFYVIYLKDASGNYSYTPLSLSKQIMEKVPSVLITQNEEDENLVDINFNIEKTVGYKDYQFEYNIFANEDGKVVYYPCQTTTAQKDNFFFAYAKATFQAGQLNLTKFSYPVFFYSGNETCELKDLIDGTNGAQIYCDKPCLVMTYWSSENYGYSIQDWEAFGVQSNVMYISAKKSETNEYEETVKYYTVNYDEIPMGKYFVVIAHFADGTSVMSKRINTN